MNDSNFHSDRFLGRWYELARSPRIPFQHGSDVEFIFKSKKAPHYDLVLKQNPKKGARNAMEGRAIALPDDPSRMRIFFKSHLLHSIFYTDFRIIATDYEDYAIAHSINRIFFFWKIEWAWILSRSPKASPEKMDGLLDQLEKLTGIKRNQIKIKDQKHIF